MITVKIEIFTITKHLIYNIIYNLKVVCESNINRIAMREKQACSNL